MTMLPDVSAEDESALAVRLRTVVEEGGLSAGLRLCQSQIKDEPGNQHAYRHMAYLHAVTGNKASAFASGHRACELAPSDPRTWSDLGRVHAMFGELERAADCFARAVEVDVRHADSWHNLGLALHKLGKLEPALTALKNVLLIDPQRADAYLAMGNLFTSAGQFEDAIEALERAARLDPKLARARSNLAEQLAQRGKLHRAETVFRQSLGLDPHHLDGWLGLGRALEDLGQRDGAVDAYRNVLKREPRHPVALGHYLALVPNDANEWAANAERAVHDAGIADGGKALIGYGLTKYYDRRGDLASAAAAGRHANAARRRSAGPLDRDELIARIDSIIESYSRDFFASRRRHGLGSDQPVFIVGLPRSGTTLTEQIIAAHPLAHGAGELPDLARLAVNLVADDEEPWQAAGRIDDVRSRVAAGVYLDAARSRASQTALRVTDKSPLNFFHLALVAVTLPGARIIHCRRDERDNALSIWGENFNAAQRYATDFDDLAFFIEQYRRLMAHWRAVLPLRMLEVEYETTVASLEKQARRIIQFLGLPWDEQCLNFHAQERAVQTPSRWQVRNPIYDKSVGRWRTYAPHLPELLEAFDKANAGAGAKR